MEEEEVIRITARDLNQHDLVILDFFLLSYFNVVLVGVRYHA